MLPVGSVRWRWGPLIMSHLGSGLNKAPPKEGATIAHITLAISTSAWKKQHTWLMLTFHWWEPATWLCLTSRVPGNSVLPHAGKKAENRKTGELPWWLPQLGAGPTCFHLSLPPDTGDPQRVTESLPLSGLCSRNGQRPANQWIVILRVPLTVQVWFACWLGKIHERRAMDSGRGEWERDSLNLHVLENRGWDVGLGS